MCEPVIRLPAMPYGCWTVSLFHSLSKWVKGLTLSSCWCVFRVEQRWLSCLFLCENQKTWSFACVIHIVQYVDTLFWYLNGFYLWVCPRWVKWRFKNKWSTKKTDINNVFLVISKRKQVSVFFKHFSHWNSTFLVKIFLLEMIQMNIYVLVVLLCSSNHSVLHSVSHLVLSLSRFLSLSRLSPRLFIFLSSLIFAFFITSPLQLLCLYSSLCLFHFFLRLPLCLCLLLRRPSFFFSLLSLPFLLSVSFSLLLLPSS